jgi:hypothetical protein
MFRQRLDELVNLKHPLAQLAIHIDWSVFEREWAGSAAWNRNWWLCCVFRAKLDTHSTANWTLGPAQTGHAFHAKLDTQSSANWTPIPLQTGQFETA